MTARAILGAVLGLVVLASTAHAECAWVLWQENLPIGSGVSTWRITQALPAYQDCERAKANQYDYWTKCATDAEANPRSAIEVIVLGRMISTWTKAKAGADISSWAYQCIPDTVDPRTPKGGAR